MDVEDIEKHWKKTRILRGASKVGSERWDYFDFNLRLCIAYAEHLVYDIEQLPEVNQEWQSALSRMKGE